MSGKEMQRHKNPETKLVPCRICPRTFRNKSELLMHEKSHKGNTEKYLKPKHESKCPHCEKVFREKGNLKKHISSVHDKLRKFQCHLCDSTFTDSTPLRIHLKRHKADPIKQFNCDICDKSFKIEDELKVHVKHIHTERNVTYVGKNLVLRA